MNVRKKFMAGAAILALLMNAPQVKADDIVVFGGEFEDNVPAPKKVEKPAPIKDLPPAPPKPIEEPAPAVEPAPPPPEIIEPQPPTQPLEQPDEPQQPAQVEQPAEPQDVSSTPPEEDDDIGDTLTFNDLNKKPEQKPLEQPTPPPAVEEPTPAPITQEPPTVEPPQVEPIINEPTPAPITEPTTPAQIEEPVFERPFEQPGATSGEDVVVVLPPTPPQPTFTPPPTPQPVEQIEPIEPLDEQPVREQPARQRSTPRHAPQKNLQTLQPRFIKLAVDETYTYYLDKNSVQWIKMPYSTSEYIADVWIRMIERNPAPLDDDMASYGADNFNAEISLAREQGYQYAAEDVHVLRSQAYVLEHYYLRPKTRQIQFLCELEVFGRPQNTVSERAYDYRNWENLVPGSVESVIYASTIKVIGEWKSTERGHMTFSDMLDEYLRISL